MPLWAISSDCVRNSLPPAFRSLPVHLTGKALRNDHVCTGLPSESRTWIARSVGWTFTHVCSYHCRSAFSVVIPRLSVMLPCLMRVGRRCTKLLIPPSGYSITSICDEKPVTCVKNPSCRLIAGIVTWKYFEWVTGGLASVTVAAVIDALGSGVVDDQVAHLLALGEQIALEAIEEVVVELLALLLLVLGAGRVGRRAAGVVRDRGGVSARGLVDELAR